MLGRSGASATATSGWVIRVNKPTAPGFPCSYTKLLSGIAPWAGERYHFNLFFFVFVLVRFPCVVPQEEEEEAHGCPPLFFPLLKKNRPRRGAQVQPPVRHWRWHSLHRRAVPRRHRQHRLAAGFRGLHGRRRHHICARKPGLRRVGGREERLPGFCRRELLPDLGLGRHRDDGLGELEFCSFILKGGRGGHRFSLLCSPLSHSLPLFPLPLSRPQREKKKKKLQDLPGRLLHVDGAARRLVLLGLRPRFLVPLRLLRPRRQLGAGRRDGADWRRRGPRVLGCFFGLALLVFAGRKRKERGSKKNKNETGLFPSLVRSSFLFLFCSLRSKEETI